MNVPFSYEFDHVGIAVSSLTEAAKPYLALGWTTSHMEEVPAEKVRVQMFELGNNCRIELIESTSPESTITKFIARRGPGIHHLCLRVSDIDAALSRAREHGLRLIHETPFLGAHNCRVAFLHPKSMGGVLVELSQPLKAGH
jgi:methylmalonyl-CoA/ethylmalonyl-CoA epimerase